MKNPKLIIALIVSAVLLQGCTDQKVTSGVEAGGSPVTGLKEVVIEGCQYLVVENGRPSFQMYAIAMTHKGNCTNRIHHAEQTK